MSTRALVRAAFAALCALTLSGCIDSAKPILIDAEPVLGKTLRLQFYSLRKGVAHDPQQATYRWNGALYAHAGGGMREISAFSVHPFEAGDYIIQSVPSRRAGITEYAVMRRLAEGVFLVVPVDEDDADDPTRADYCKRVEQSACRIGTREELFAFARFTAARQKDKGGLAILLPDAPERQQRRPRR